MPRYTGPVNFVLEAIKEEKNRTSKRLHVSVTFRGEYYYVTHWWSDIAIGKRGSLPELMNLHGFNTVTTINLLSALGFDLSSRKIKYGQPFRNKKTGRMNHQRGSVMHIGGNPMLDPNGEPDYNAWYDHFGNWINKNFNPEYARA